MNPLDHSKLSIGHIILEPLNLAAAFFKKVQHLLKRLKHWLFITSRAGRLVKQDHQDVFMRSCNPFVVFAVLMLGYSVNALGQDPTPEDSGIIPTLNDRKTAVLPRNAIRVASDRLPGFNLLSNNPPVPKFEMHDEAGHKVTFDKFQGKVVLFNLWATWCPPCIREMPELNALQAQYKDDGFIVVPVASGQQGDEDLPGGLWQGH